MDSSEKYGREYEFREVPLFQTPEEIKSKKGVHRSHRFAYLQRLVNEFQETEDIKAKQEILAHLANFAYDSVNYEYLRQLHVIDLFLDMLIEEDIELKRFGIGGLCNCCIDPKNIEIILKPENKGLLLIKKCLSSSDEETVLSAITTLFYLLNPTTAPKIATKPLISCLQKYCESTNVRLKNLASILLQDCYKTINFSEI